MISYRLYDVGYALDLERAARLLEGQATGRPRPTRGEAKALVIAQPPLTIALGPVVFPGGHAWPAAHMSACCYDFGVISLRLRAELADGAPWADLVGLARSLERADLAGVFGPALAQLASQLAPAITRPGIAPVSEDYTISRLTALRDAAGATALPSALDDVALVELLLDEPRALTEDARRNLLSRRFSYTEHDLAVLSWSAALVVEPAAGDQDVEFLLEFANAQLLELRVYDAYLDAELPQLYDRASLARRGAATLLVRRFEHVLAGLHTLVADITEVVERVENGLKVTNDVYLARIYQAALALFREDAWRLGVSRKLGIFRDTYAMLNDEAQTARGNVLEVIIILLIVIEVVMGLIRH
ncbi:MAG TPA: hypothetical protein VFN08_19040 [Gemmatimonadales bacterium]|nr:hypothetical protein [Gemmatimonadales bacterium]